MNLVYPQSYRKIVVRLRTALVQVPELRVQDLNFDMQVMTVHDGKGLKDRTLPMPSTLTAELSAQIEQVAILHEEDLAAKTAGVFLPSALDVKYTNASKEFAGQWLFPAKSLTLVPGSEDYPPPYLYQTLGLVRLRRLGRDDPWAKA